MEEWARKNNIELKFIQTGKPHQNGFIERFNRSYSEEVLDAFAFESLRQAQLLSNAWIWVYNNERPHSSLNYNTPVSFLLKYGKLHQRFEQPREFPTFQQDNNIKYKWKSLILNATN